ncbi:amidohydrolase family protein [Paenibacillus senegalensis]|uniref:amidohydrolase family protein n=1 Tax=Paenibacillus senegalensis TaxID=1465766 RepID=UPI000288F4AF|nr:TatD family hydrolase [Paenibacillus senegalensis]
MNIIDAHVHLSRIASFQQTADELSLVDYTADGLSKEFAANGVVLGIGMGVNETAEGGFPDRHAANPMTLNLEDKLPNFLLECTGINPYLLESGGQAELDRIEKRLSLDSTAGIKLYAGYYHFYVYDKIYGPIYELAKQYNLPVVIHTGDTYSKDGLIKYSHPLTVDELAVSHRDINFVLCHLGDPWVMDAAEVVRKNPNVYADLSGLQVGDGPFFQRFVTEPLFMDHFRRALIYADHYDKILFGTDWPLAPVEIYIRFVEALVPESFYSSVFYENALNVFPKARKRLEG